MFFYHGFLSNQSIMSQIVILKSTSKRKDNIMKLNKKSIAKTLIVLILITTMLVLTGCAGNVDENGIGHYPISPSADCPLDTGIALVDIILDALWFILSWLLVILLIIAAIFYLIIQLVVAIVWGIIKNIALGFAMIIRWLITTFIL